MKIEELREEKLNLETEIHCAINSYIKDFQLKTGIYPYGLSISMVEVTRVGDAKPRYVVEKVTVDIKI